MSQFNVGDCVRTLTDDEMYNDYAAGATAVIISVHENGMSPFAYVAWDEPHYHDERDDLRCTLLFFDEMELVPEETA